ncbi:hypothetical protein [Streptomyces ardesiacus]|uniref:hypothetical protein n=1 Tax=Streptomyces ardesiacus TaxID=285564 RepID=UPI00364956E3
MSARSFIARVAVSAGYSHESAELLVQRALDEHAHELAEKIRDTYVDYSADVCADLIDPELEQ